MLRFLFPFLIIWFLLASHRSTLVFILLAVGAFVVVNTISTIDVMAPVYKLRRRFIRWFKKLDKALSNSVVGSIIFPGLIRDLLGKWPFWKALDILPTLICALLAPSHFYKRIGKIIARHTPLLSPVPFFSSALGVAGLVYALDIATPLQLIRDAIRMAHDTVPVGLLFAIFVKLIWIGCVIASIRTEYASLFVALQPKIIPPDLFRERQRLQGNFFWGSLYFCIAALLSAPALFFLLEWAENIGRFTHSPTLEQILGGRIDRYVFILFAGASCIFLVVRPLICCVLYPVAPIGGVGSVLSVSFVSRIIGIAKLDFKKLSEVRTNPSAGLQSLMIFMIVSAALQALYLKSGWITVPDVPLWAGFGKWSRYFFIFVNGALLNFVFFLVYVWLCYAIGALIFKGRKDSATFTELARAAGFALLPGSTLMLVGLLLSFEGWLFNSIIMITFLYAQTFVVAQVAGLNNWKGFSTALLSLVLVIFFGKIAPYIGITLN